MLIVSSTGELAWHVKTCLLEKYFNVSSAENFIQSDKR